MRDGSIAFLSLCVPNSQLADLIVYSDRFSQEIVANRGFSFTELTSHKCCHEAALADTSVTNNANLELVVPVRNRIKVG